MKIKVFSVISLAIAAFTVMTVGAAACRQGPTWDGGFYEEVYAGEITAGENQVTITDNECKVFSFTPEYDGFYELTYSDHSCCFMKDSKEDDNKIFYEYIASNYIIGDIRYKTEIYKFEANKTYKLYIENEYTYDALCENGAGTEMISPVIINYLGQITDFDILDKEYEINDNNTISILEENGEPAQWLYSEFDVTFEDGSTFYYCYLRENCCNNLAFEIVNDFVPQEGENKVTLSLMGFEKEFTINCYYPEPVNEDYVDYIPYELPEKAPDRNPSFAFKLASHTRAVIELIDDFNSSVKEMFENIKSELIK